MPLLDEFAVHQPQRPHVADSPHAHVPGLERIALGAARGDQQPVKVRRRAPDGADIDIFRASRRGPVDRRPKPGAEGSRDRDRFDEGRPRAHPLHGAAPAAGGEDVAGAVLLAIGQSTDPRELAQRAAIDLVVVPAQREIRRAVIRIAAAGAE